ncbi:DASH family cryptochrome [Endozoicomonas lisbonensis]|uniref:Cryptochrome DASH n=1 Tax=Endozoicomonas lisbonensis TaxID=3120522 RepID=A0ABV2SJ15_9GAMM
MRKGIYCFHRDLRVSDNPLLSSALEVCDELAFIYIVTAPDRFTRHFSPHVSKGACRSQFENSVLVDLKKQLVDKGFTLTVYRGSRVGVLSELIQRNRNITDVFTNTDVDYNCVRAFELLQRDLPHITFHHGRPNTLWSQDNLPFDLQNLPISFTQFRKRVEKQPPEASVGIPNFGKTALLMLDDSLLSIADVFAPDEYDKQWLGGECAGKKHLDDYFGTPRALTYKETRNHFDQWDFSTAFSPWLAWGCITPKQVLRSLLVFERANTSSDSTYWIYFELLWREYFHWYALKHGAALFSFKGLKQTKPLTTFYPECYRAWCEGETGYEIVDACMKQLNQTGMISNRGRQLVASCFVHELGLDWRFGAAYFEAMLIDYDVGSNWGNWQYLAGVGADPRGHRKFDLDKQAQWYDPEGTFRCRWLE